MGPGNMLPSPTQIDKTYTLHVLEKLISIPTVNPPGKNYDEIAQYLEETLTTLGIKAKTVMVPEEVVAQYYPWAQNYPRYIVIGRVGEGRPVLHFNGHYDVVPAGHGWTKDPFKPSKEDDKVYGRGASDMKGGIAAIIAMLRGLQEEGWEPSKGSIEVSFTPDEEVGGKTGVKYMLDSGLSFPDYAIVAEPSGLDRIWIGSRGILWMNIKIYGKQAHGSAPWLGLNAFEGMVKIAHHLIEEYKNIISRRKTDLPMDDERGAYPSVTIGGEVDGGAKTNIVPGFYSFSIDRRIIPGEDVDFVEKELREFVNSKASLLERQGYRVEVEVTEKAPATWISERSPFVEIISQIIEKELRQTPLRTVCIGGLDTRYFQERGINAVTLGPGILEIAHMPDEYIELESVVKAAQIYSVLAKNVDRLQRGL